MRLSGAERGGGMEISVGESADRFPSPNLLTLCHLFLLHKATFIHHRR